MTPVIPEGQGALMRRFRKRGRDVAAIILQSLFTVVAFIGWLRGDRRQYPDGKDIKKILLIRLDLLGDLFLTMPAVAAVRDSYPQAHISMLVLPYTAPALSLFSYVDKVLTFDINKLRPSGDMLNLLHYRDLWRLIRLLRRERYDLAVSFYGLYAGLFAYLSGAPMRVGYRGEGCPFLFTLKVPGRRYARRQHEVEYDLTLAAAAGARRLRDGMQYRIPAGAQERVTALMSAEGIGQDDQVIVFHCGSANGTAKRWPAERWCQLGDMVMNSLCVRVVLSGVASEVPLVQEIARGMAAQPVILAGKTSIAEMAALLARSRLLVSGDSAPLHMAWVFSVPVVALFGPTDPAISGPYEGRAVVLREKSPCSPCYDLSDTAECYNNSLVCMESIDPEQVYAAIERLCLEPAETTAGTAS